MNDLLRTTKAAIAVAAAALVACLAATTASTTTAAAQAPLPQCATTHWVAAWTADPSGALGGGYDDQTLRLILTPHLGGDHVRVHLSNRLGAAPVTFAGAAIALRQAGAALVPGSTRRLSFAGRADVTVPVGAEAISDPVAFSFSAFDDLAVSLYLAAPTGPATGHLIARQRSYATAPAAGDHAADESAGAYVDSTTSVDYVDAVDVLAPAAVGAAVLFGDSLTDGYQGNPAGAESQAGIDGNQRYPDDLARRLLATAVGPRLSVLNAGVSANQLRGGGPASAGGTSGLGRLDDDAIGVSGVTDVIVLEGINDIAVMANSGQVSDALSQVIARLHARDLHVLLGTIPPAGTGLLSLLPGVYIDSGANAVRLAVNAWIRSRASGADGVIDFDAALRGAAQPNELDPNLDSGDHIHPNDEGYRRMAAAVDLTQLAGARCTQARIATTLHVRARGAAARRLRLTGALATAAPADCTGLRLTVRALRAGRTIFKRHLPLAASCRYAATESTPASGRIEVRVSFPGSPVLLSAHARPAYARVR